jgi:nicotinamidase-related amidase
LKPLGQKSALVVIDMQNGFDDATWGTRNNPSAEACVELLMKAWREAAAPVIHVHHHSTHPTRRQRSGAWRQMGVCAELMRSTTPH